MKDNLLNSASQNTTSCMGCDLYLLQYHWYQVSCVMILIKLSVKFAHSCAIKHGDFMLSSCNTVAIELQVTCSCGIITIEHLIAYAFFMKSSCTIVQLNSQSFDISMLHCRSCIVQWLVHALCQSWTACTYNMLWCNNNCWLRSCSHNYQFIYCWYIIAITNEASAFNLTATWTECWVHQFVKEEYHPFHFYCL
jgi:hypothetical protein